MKLRDMLKDRLKEDEELADDFEFIKDFGMAIILSGIIIIISFITVTLILFYSSPFLLVWSALLLMLRIRVCDSGIDLSLINIIRKYIRISITIK